MNKPYCLVENNQVVAELSFLPIHLRQKTGSELRQLGYFPLVRKDETHKGMFIDEDDNLTDAIDIHYEIKTEKHYIILSKYVIGVFKKRKKTEEETKEYLESYKGYLLKELKNKREELLKEKFSFEFSDGYAEVDLSDPIDVRRIQTQVIAASISSSLSERTRGKSKGKNKSLRIRDKNKKVHQVSNEKILDLWEELSEYEQKIDDVYWEKENEINSFKTIEECLNYDVNLKIKGGDLNAL